MKIGKFAATHHITIDAIRHYMDLGLIVPEKHGGQYVFDENCHRDLEDTMKLKNMGFTLNEILSIFQFKRLGKLTPYQENALYQEFFHNKHHEVSRQLEDLQIIKANLEQKIMEFSAKGGVHKASAGIDVSHLPLFRCPKCHGSLRLFNAYITDHQIVHGILRCPCGEEYIIDDGILVVGEAGDNGGEVLSDSIIEYIKATDEEYLSNVYLGLEWSSKRLCHHDLKNKTILELGSGLGFFLRYVYDEIPEGSIYIAVDHDLKRHRFLKSILERSQRKKNIVFICCDFLQIPLKENCVDVLLDLSGTTNYSFEHEEFLLHLVDHYIKENAILLAGYILFKNFGMDTLIPEKSRKNFILKNVQQNIKDLGYHVLEERVSDYLAEGGKYESFFKKGEEIYTYSFHGKR